MQQNESLPGVQARVLRAAAITAVSLGACVGYALWVARATIPAQGYAALGFERSAQLELLDAAWEGWAMGLEVAPRVGLAALLFLLVLRLFPRLRPTPENLLAAVTGTGRATLVFAAGAFLMGALGLHLLERQITRESAWLGPGDMVAAGAALLIAYIGIGLASRRARRGDEAKDIQALLWGTALLSLGAYWLNRGLWAPPRETYVLERNVLLFVAAALVTTLARGEFLRAALRALWRPLVLVSIVVAVSPALLRSWAENGAAPALTAGKPWNVVVIALDTVRVDRTSLVGELRRGQARTPELRKLADRGVNFQNAISQAPWTLPAFASILTGKYPHEHGAFTLDAKLRASELTLAEVLREAGYQTIGVVSHLYLETYRGMAQGFERFDESQALGHEAITSIQVTARAIRALEQADPDRPFFLFAHYFDPHWEYRNHEGWRFADDYDGWLTDQLDLDNLHRNRHLLDEQDLAYLEALYQEEIAYTDRHIGRLLAYLEESGQADNTLIILVGDHGEEFMEHGGLDHTTTVYQELVHVPLVIVPPGGLATELVVDGTVETRRVFGTVMELLDVDSPVVADARAESLLVATGEGDSDELQARPAPAFTSVWLEDSAPRWGKRFKLAALVDGDWKFINDLTRSEELLFYLAQDSGEEHDVKGRNAARTKKMRAELHAWIERMQEAAVGLETADTTKAQLEQLKQLGYMGAEDESDTPEERGK